MRGIGKADQGYLHAKLHLEPSPVTDVRAGVRALLFGSACAN